MRHLSRCLASLLLTVAIPAHTCTAATVTYDTAQYWPIVSGSYVGLGTGPATGTITTLGETFVAPNWPSVKLNDFSFNIASAPGPVASLHMRAFVFAWSGSLFGYLGSGQTMGSALYLSPSFTVNPPSYPAGWASVNVNLGLNGLTLNAGQHYVMGFTLSDTADYAASQGYFMLQFVPVRNPYYNPPPIPLNVDYGGGGLVSLNNSNNFAALTTTRWSTEGSAVAAFTAHFTVVPEPSIASLTLLAASLVASRVNGTQARRRA